MGMCGYHLRCSNYWQRCSECSHQHEDKRKDYLDDALCFRPEVNEAFDADEPAFSQKADTAPFEAVFLRRMSSAADEPDLSRKVKIRSRQEGGSAL